MDKPGFVWDYKAAGEVFLKSDAIAAVCSKTAEKMTRATGMKYKPDIFVGRRRVNAGGYQQGDGSDSEDVCPKCGHDHPSCRCSSRKKRG